LFRLQHRSIVDQLYTGIRYFDLRIARKPRDSSNYLYYAHVVYTHLTVLVRRKLHNIIYIIYILSVQHCIYLPAVAFTFRGIWQTLLYKVTYEEYIC